LRQLLLILLIGYLVLPLSAQVSQDSAQIKFDEIYAIELSDPEGAILQYQEALEVFEKEDYNRGVASVYNTLANSNLYRGFYTQALKQYQLALPYYEQPGEEYSLTIILNNMASMFQHNEDQNTSLQYLQRALTISKELNDDKALANSYNNINAAYIQLEDYKKAFSYGDSAVTYISKTDEDKLSVLMHANLAKASVNINETAKAHQLLSKAEAQSKKLDDIETEIVIAHSWAFYYLNTREYSKSLVAGQKALSLLSQFEDQRYEEKTLSILYKAADALGRKELALNYYKKIDTVKSQSFLKKQNTQVAELEAIYQSNKKEQLRLLSSQV